MLSQIFLGTLGPVIISAGALVSIFGTLNVIMLACTRFAVCDGDTGPAAGAPSRVHERFRTPHMSIFISAAAALYARAAWFRSSTR